MNSARAHVRGRPHAASNPPPAPRKTLALSTSVSLCSSAMAAAGGEEEAGESRKLFVGGIPAGAQEPELRAHFSRFGEVRSVIVMRDRETGHGRGFGFVEFEEEAAAGTALGDGEKLKHFLCGRMVSLRSFRI